MTLTIGVAIPCYSGHFQFLMPLIENIANSTRKPDSISISCSSWYHDRREFVTYKDIPVHIWYSSKRLNVSQNRNRAASLLNTDLISFIDADDVMHPKRIEFVANTLQARSDISAVYHDYVYEDASKRYDPFWEESSPNPLPNPMIKDPNAFGIIVSSDPPNQYSHHHAQVTVRSSVFSMLKFDESWGSYRKEDSLYGATLLKYNVPCLYLHNKLSRYIFNQ